MFVSVCLSRNYAVRHGVREGEISSVQLRMLTLPGHGQPDAGHHLQGLLASLPTVS